MVGLTLGGIAGAPAAQSPPRPVPGGDARPRLTPPPHPLSLPSRWPLAASLPLASPAVCARPAPAQGDELGMRAQRAPAVERVRIGDAAAIHHQGRVHCRQRAAAHGINVEAAAGKVGGRVGGVCVFVVGRHGAAARKSVWRVAPRECRHPGHGCPRLNNKATISVGSGANGEQCCCPGVPQLPGVP